MAPPTTELFTLSLHDALPISALGPVDELDQVAEALARGLDHRHGNVVPPLFAGNLLDEGELVVDHGDGGLLDRKSTRLNSSHRCISYAVFCLKKKSKQLVIAH